MVPEDQAAPADLAPLFRQLALPVPALQLANQREHAITIATLFVRMLFDPLYDSCTTRMHSYWHEVYLLTMSRRLSLIGEASTASRSAVDDPPSRLDVMSRGNAEFHGGRVPLVAETNQWTMHCSNAGFEIAYKKYYSPMQ